MRLRFTTRVLVLQLATVVCVVAVCLLVFSIQSLGQLREEAKASALSIARTLAEDEEVRTRVAAASADYPGAEAPPNTAFAAGPLQEHASAVTARTGALFVVITDDHGIRLAHPDPTKIGAEVSTSYAEALAGHEVVEWERGTLGSSARAKVPVYAPGSDEPVGEISVGFERSSVYEDLPGLLLGIAAAGLLAVGIGALASLVLRRRWERLTLGLQPEDLVTLVHNQTAVLEGVGEGVLALDPDGVVRVCNARAAVLLGLDDPVGRPLDALGLPPSVLEAIGQEHSGTGPRELLVDGHVLYVERHVSNAPFGSAALGVVVILRDRTDLVALTERLDTVRTMTQALRVHRHEEANRVHVVAGLLDAGRVAEARDYLDELHRRGPVDFPLVGEEFLSDPFLLSFLGAKALEASEKDVSLEIGEDTLVLGTVAEVEDVATVLGNLVDNAIAAVVDHREFSGHEEGSGHGEVSGRVEVSGRGEDGRVVVTLLDEADTLVLTVQDSGPGFAEAGLMAPTGRDTTAGPGTTAGPDDPAAASGEVGGAADGSAADGGPVLEDAHGHGIGLPLSRDLARRRGGELWVLDRGGHGRTGATLAARLPGVMRARTHDAHDTQDTTEGEGEA